MTIRLRALKKREREDILAVMRDHREDLACRERLQIIWFAHRGWSAPQIKASTLFHAATIRRWIRAFNKGGIDALRALRYRLGVQPRITVAQKENIVQIALQNPRDLGCLFDQWSLPKLRDYLRGQEIVDEISIEWIRKILKAAGIIFSRPRASVEPGFVREHETSASICPVTLDEQVL
jgi:transposase